MTNHANSPWTDELRAEVKEMWKTLTASEIAIAFQERGYCFTRNSIIGLLHRSGLTAEQKTEARQRRPRIRSLRIVAESSADMGRDPRNISLHDLGKNECRYPYGDGPFTFCGHPAAGSYCAAHASLCYIAPERRMAA